MLRASVAPVIWIISRPTAAAEERSVDVRVSLVTYILGQQAVGLQARQTAVSIVKTRKKCQNINFHLQSVFCPPVAEGVAVRLPAALVAAVLQTGGPQSVLHRHVGELVSGPHQLRAV